MSSGLVFHFGNLLDLVMSEIRNEPGDGSPGPCRGNRRPPSTLDRCRLLPFQPGAKKMVETLAPKELGKQWLFRLHSDWEVEESEPSKHFSDLTENLFVY